MQIKNISLILPLLFSLSISACSSWGFKNIEQGNILTEAQTTQIHPGMSREAVTKILGSPVLSNPFNRDRWEYVHLYRGGNGVTLERKLIVRFNGDRVAAIEENRPPT